MRKPLQGVLNIVRFNWHYYAIAFSLLFVLLIIAGQFNEPAKSIIYILAFLAIALVFVSLLISVFIYDFSDFYRLNWVETRGTENLIVNINAGFDETSGLLKNKFKTARLIVLDFYDAEKHTEVSIKRARRSYPPFAGTQQITTNDLQLSSNSADVVFVILAAHEIRNTNERNIFFNELKRIVKPTGRIYITEHLRDTANFLAYNIGFFHFHSKRTWLANFKNAGLEIKQEKKLTPFISNFILEKNGNSF